MKSIYKDILTSSVEGKKLLAVLIDPDKMTIEMASGFMEKVNRSIATHIFVGGSIVEDGITDFLVATIKKLTNLPVVLFPGDITQITDKADALLFLSLISGGNPDYLIRKHVASIPKLRHSDLEVIPTGYMLIENGKETSVQKVTGTKPMSRKNIRHIIDTALAGELLGLKLIYLEAGSGAMNAITNEIISSVKNELGIPLIVGGGIKTKVQLNNAFDSGADIVVIGTAFEDDESFFEELRIK